MGKRKTAIWNLPSPKNEKLTQKVRFPTIS